MGMRENIEFARIVEAVVHKLRHDNDTRDLGNSAFTVPDDAPSMLFYDPGGGAVTVTMPTEAVAKGRVFYIYNAASGAEAISLVDDAAGAIGDLLQGETGILSCDGVSWSLLVGTTT